MRAGDELQLRSDLPKWRAALAYVGDFGDVATWGLGRWIHPGWDEPLPDVLVIDENFVEKYRGIPFLYMWRINALDLTSLGAGFGGKYVLGLLSRGGAMLRDLGIVTGLGLGMEHTSFGINRSKDEVISGLEPSSPIFWLSLSKIQENGYKSYEIKEDKYVFYK